MRLAAPTVSLGADARGGKAIVGENLVQLAEQFLRLSGELDATRDAMRRLLLNGAEEPPKTPSTMPGQSRAGASIRTRERRKRPEEKILELLQHQPGTKTGAIAQATGSPVVTVQDRLRRLRQRGAVTGGGGWVATAPA
jgi:Winged helix-turn-helix DNA-binding